MTHLVAVVVAVVVAVEVVVVVVVVARGAVPERPVPVVTPR